MWEEGEEAETWSIGLDWIRFLLDCSNRFSGQCSTAFRFYANSNARMQMRWSHTHTHTHTRARGRAIHIAISISLLAIIIIKIIIPTGWDRFDWIKFDDAGENSIQLDANFECGGGGGGRGRGGCCCSADVI